MKRNLVTWVFIVISALVVKAQNFAPQVGFESTTAIHKDDAIFIDWANSVTITRGYKDIAIPNNGLVDYGVSSNAIGEANLSIVSLGDGGEAILSFNQSITNGNGADFAVFENGFLEDEESELAFLELAYVEVSTDGVDYVRFPSVSENQIDTQIDGFGYMNARYIYNFAGKYIQNYGTPFDLSELILLVNGTTVDLDNINFIKLVDVVGTIDANFATHDNGNNIVNDPYPSNFSSGGFDLNAIGVINNTTTNSINKSEVISFSIYPNPVKESLTIITKNTINLVEIYSMQGKLLFSINTNHVNVDFLANGIYLVSVETEMGKTSAKFIKTN